MARRAQKKDPTLISPGPVFGIIFTIIVIYFFSFLFSQPKVKEERIVATIPAETFVSPSPSVPLLSPSFSPSPTLYFVHTPTIIIPTLKATPTPNPAIQQSLLSAVTNFYNYISKQEINSAYNLLSKNFQRETGGYERFSQGFSTTKNATIKEIKVTNLSANLIYIKLETTDLFGDKTVKRQFAGTWKLTLEGESWKLDMANIYAI